MNTTAARTNTDLQVYGQGDVDSLEIPKFVADAINAVLGNRGQGGIFIADRTAGSATVGKRWVPSTGNLRYLPPIDEIAAGDKDAWATFPGSWGIDQVTTDPMDFSIACVSDLDSTAEGHTSQGEPLFFLHARALCGDTCGMSLWSEQTRHTLPVLSSMPQQGMLNLAVACRST